MAKLIQVTQQVSISYLLGIEEDSPLVGYGAESLGALANSGLEYELTSYYEGQPTVIAPKVNVRGFAVHIREMETV